MADTIIAKSLGEPLDGIITIILGNAQSCAPRATTCLLAHLGGLLAFLKPVFVRVSDASELSAVVADRMLIRKFSMAIFIVSTVSRRISTVVWDN